MKNKIIILLLAIVLLLLGFILFFKKDMLVKNQLVEDESAVVGVVEQASDSVVTISNEGRDVGTGFVITTSGLIVTNKHVVPDASVKYKVVLEKELVDVVNIYRDPVTDLAIVKVNKINLKPVVLGDSDKIKVGQTVIAIGTALGEYRSTVTKGVISGLGRGIVAGSPFEGSERLDNVIQTDAAINPGNSGGPLFNLKGEVIGVNVAVNQGAQSIGFALPINLVKESVDNFGATGQFDRPFLGVEYRMVTLGASVKNVVLESSAQKAGIMIGDIITEIDDKKLAEEKNTVLSTYINRKRVGESVKIKILRNNGEINLTVILEKKG